MTKYVAFLRGINVGGHNMIRMENLRQMFVSLGFENVKTYIQSGNVIFESAQTNTDKLSAIIEKAIAAEFSLEIKVMVRAMADIEELIKHNPFKQQLMTDADLYVVFLSEELSDEKKNLLHSLSNEFEIFEARGREVFCLIRKGYKDNSLGKKYIDNKLKTPATARNWRTVNKITEF